MNFDPRLAGNKQFSPKLRLGLPVLLVSASFLALSGAQSASGQGFQMTALSVPGSTGESTPWSINTSGEVVGTFTPKGESNTKGFLYSGGKYTILSGPPGTDGPVRALGINSAKTPVIVGDYLEGNRIHGFMYKSGKYILTPFDYNSTDSTGIFDINDNGDFVGAFGHMGEAQEGFAVIKGDKIPFYGQGTDSTYAQGINNSDEVVGQFFDSKGLAHGFLRAASGKITVIDYPGAAQTYLYEINTAGEISGAYITSTGQDFGFTYAKGKFKVADFATVNGLNADGAYDGTYFGVDGTATGYVALPQAFTLSKVAIPSAYSEYGAIICAINNAGVMVGGYNDASGNSHGMMIDDGKVTIIDNPAGVQTALFAINSKGEIAGDSYDNQGNPHGFVYSNGTFTDVPGPSGALSSDATGVNDLGWIAGDFYGADKTHHAFILKGKTYKELNVPGAVATYAAGMNNSGMVVLAYVDAKAYLESSLWTGSKYEAIDVPGASQNFAASINNAGDIAYRILDQNNDQHAALKKGNDYYVFDYPGGVDSGAQGINDSGEITGFYSPPNKTSITVVFKGTE
jgi:probable HAF family extracellular repeat protein